MQLQLHMKLSASCAKAPLRKGAVKDLFEFLLRACFDQKQTRTVCLIIPILSIPPSGIKDSGLPLHKGAFAPRFAGSIDGTDTKWLHIL